MKLNILNLFGLSPLSTLVRTQKDLSITKEEMKLNKEFYQVVISTQTKKIRDYENIICVNLKQKDAVDPEGDLLNIKGDKTT